MRFFGWLFVIVGVLGALPTYGSSLVLAFFGMLLLAIRPPHHDQYAGWGLGGALLRRRAKRTEWKRRHHAQ